MIKNYPTLKNLVPLFFLLFAFCFINAQTANQNFIDVKNDIPSQVCAGSNITVNFTAKNGDKTYEYYNNSSIYYVYILDASNNFTLLKPAFSTTGVSYCGIDNCITTLQTNVTIPANFPTGTYTIRIYSDLPDMKWLGPSNAFTVNSLPIVPLGPTNGSRCGTGTVSLSVTNPGAGFTIDWYAASTGGSVLSGGSGTSNFTTPSISSTTTYYSETRNTTTGCVSASRTAVTATINPIPNVVISNPAAVCSPSTVNLTLAAVTTGSTVGLTFTYWTNVAATASYATPTAATAGTYYIKGTIAATGCFDIKPVTVTVSPTTVGGSVAGGTTICSGSTSALLTLSGHTGTITKWQSSVSPFSTWTDIANTATTYTSGALSVTTQFRAVVQSGSCAAANSTSTTVMVNLLPAVPTTTSASICSGSSATLAASGAVATQFYKWYSLETGGVLIKTGTDNTDNTYATSAIIATTDYWVSIVNSNGCESIRTKVTAFVNLNNRWNGSVDRDWNKAGNWCIGVPTIGVANTLDVLIPSGLTNYPIIYAGAISGYVKTIVLEDNTTLNVRENSLRVTHNLTLSGNSKIDFEGESQLLQDDLSGYVGTGTIEIDQQGTGNSFRYNYWSSPVNSRGAKYTIGEVLKNGTNPITPITYGAAYAFADGAMTSPIQLSTYWMYVLRNSGAGYAAWYRVGNTGEVSVGEGYTMKGSNTTPAEQNYTFVGKPNNGDITLPLNAGFDYLVGNPYPSAIDAALFLWDNQNSILGGVIYFWEHYGGNTHNLAGYQGGYATRNLLAGTPASSAIPAGVSNLGSSVKGAPGPDIALGQAFFVVGDVDGGNIQFKNSQRVFEKESDGYSIFMKNSNTKAKTENTHVADLRPKFRIGFDAPKISHRQLLIGVDERATNGVDWGFDAEIYEVFADDMYWILEGKKYVIQGTNNVGLNSEVPIGIQLSKTGMVTVKIDALENVDDDTAIYLKDKVTGESFNMREKPVQLNLTAGKYADRFVLLFKTQKLLEEDVKAEILIPAAAQPIIEGIHVFMNNANGELQIKNNSTEEIISVALINAVGQTLKTWNSNFNIRTISLPLSTATGVYLVQINTKTGKTVKKISVE